ncbi:MAG: hypothetical protein RJQ14_16920 [Marinoscillum sp.]
MKKYMILTSGLSALMLIAFYVLNDAYLAGWLHPRFPALVLFFFLQSLMIIWLFHQGEKEGWKTPIYSLAAITFRFLTGLFLLLILIVMKLPEIRNLVIQFIALYLGYLVFELFAVLPNLRRN